MKDMEYNFEERVNITITAINAQLIRVNAPFWVVQLSSKTAITFGLEAKQTETQYAYISFTATNTFIEYVTKQAHKQNLKVRFCVDGRSFWFEEENK